MRLVDCDGAGPEADQLRLWYFIGEMDHHTEMKLLMEERKNVLLATRTNAQILPPI